MLNLFQHLKDYKLKEKTLKRVQGDKTSFCDLYSKSAFTLAEVLITLVIIGVIVAITVPTLITKYQKEQTVVRLKKAYSVLGNAWQRSHFEFGSPDENIVTMGGEAYFNKYWKPFFDVGKYCDTPQACGYKSTHPYKKFDGNTASLGLIVNGWGVTFYTNDGFVYLIRVTQDTGTVSSKIVFVDINGSKGPNVIGKDGFYFDRYDKEGLGIKPQGYNATNEQINSNCSKNGYGNYCSTKIIKDGWRIADDYPW